MYKIKLSLKTACLVVGLLILSKSSISQQSSFSFTLEEAQSYAIENSYMSQTAQKEVEISESKIKETIGTGLPQINGSANYQRYLDIPLSVAPAESFGGTKGEFVEIFFGTEQQLGGSIRADQLLFDGSYFVGLQATKVYLELSKNDLTKSDIDVKSMVIEAYGNVLVARKNVEILKGNLENLEKSAFETTQLYDNGFVEEQDKDQVGLSLSSMKIAHANAVRMGDIANNQLKFILGVDISSSLELKDDLETVTSLSNSEDYLSKEFSLDSHIDFKIIRTQEKAAELLLKQQRSISLPKLSAFYTIQANAYSNEFDFLDNKRFYSGQIVGLNLSVPIFSGFSHTHRIQQSKIDLEKVNIARKQVEQQLTINAQNAKSEYTFALNQYNSSKDNLELAQRIYNKTKTKYDEGISTSLDLTQTNNQLLDVQSQHINAAFQLIKAKSNLDKAIN